MRRMVQTGLLALVMMGIGAAGASAQCAGHIYGYIDGELFVGELNDMERRTSAASGTVNAVVASGSGSYSASYNVGYYRGSDGRIIKVDCRTYQLVR